MTEWLSAQTPTVQAAVYAAAIAMIGVIINNVVTALNTERQLKHDREQKAAERALSLRRDIYLGVAEHIDNQLSSLVNFTDLSLEHKDIVTELNSASHYLAKLHLMAKPDFLQAISEVERAVHSATVKIRIRRDQLLEQRSNISALGGRIADHRKRAADITDTIRIRAISGDLPQLEFDRLAKIIKHEMDAADALVPSHNQLQDELRRNRWGLLSEALAEEKKIHPLVVKASAAARAELGEMIDMTVYDGILARAHTTDHSDLQQLFGAKESPSDAQATEKRATS